MKQILCLLLALLALSFVHVSADDSDDFIRGDVNGDGVIDVSDVVVYAAYWNNGPNVPCRDAADLDSDNDLGEDDLAYLISFLYGGGPAPGAPWPGCGADPDDDVVMDCEWHSCQ